MFFILAYYLACVIQTPIIASCSLFYIHLCYLSHSNVQERSFDWNCTNMPWILKMLWSDWHGVWIPGLDAGMLPGGTTATAVLSEGTQPLCPCVLSLCLEGTNVFTFFSVH